MSFLGKVNIGIGNNIDESVICPNCGDKGQCVIGFIGDRNYPNVFICKKCGKRYEIDSLITEITHTYKEANW